MFLTNNSWVGDSLGWVDWGRAIVGLSSVLDISDVTRIGISNIVGHDLCTAIRKSHTVLAVSGISITSLILAKAGARILVSNTVFISIDSWTIIGRLLVAMDRLGWVVRSWVGHNWHHWGWVISWADRSWVSNHWSQLRGHPGDHRWQGNSCLGEDGSWVSHNGSRVVRGGPMDWHMSWSMDSCAVLLSSIGVVHILWGSMWLLGNHSSIGAMRLVHRVADSRGIAVLDHLVVGLVTGSSGDQGSSSSEKSLEYKVGFKLTRFQIHNEKLYK